MSSTVVVRPGVLGPRRRRAGSVVTYVALALPVVGGIGAIGIEYAYLKSVQRELQGVADASAHAATLRLDGTDAGLTAARADAQSIALGLRVNGHPFVLTDQDVEFGYFDVATLEFTPSDDAFEIDTVRIRAVEHEVGLGLGSIFFGKRNDVVACGAVMQGPGDASTGDVGGPGVENGHFDVDTTAARHKCAGTTECDGTTKHTHEYDDKFDITSVNQFAFSDGHLPINGCTKSNGSVATCSTSGATRVIPDTQTFKLIVVNADLSPGAWLTINGVDYRVDEYDDTDFASLPTFALGASVAGATRLTQLTVNFDLRAIASCELIPTVTSQVKSNTKGIENEWRAGALTLQAVKTTATRTTGRSAGDHDVVATQNGGLLWESTYFWHWDGPAYTSSTASAWQSDFDLLQCNAPKFIDALVPGFGASVDADAGAEGACG